MIKTIHLLERFLSFCSSSICLWVKNNCSGGSGSETNNSLFLVLRSCFNYRLSLTSDNFICGGAETGGGGFRGVGENSFWSQRPIKRLIRLSRSTLVQRTVVYQNPSKRVQREFLEKFSHDLRHIRRALDIKHVLVLVFFPLFNLVLNVQDDIKTHSTRWDWTPPAVTPSFL